jgi:hypothetical protein
MTTNQLPKEILELGLDPSVVERLRQLDLTGAEFSRRFINKIAEFVVRGKPLTKVNFNNFILIAARGTSGEIVFVCDAIARSARLIGLPQLQNIIIHIHDNHTP